MYRLNSLNSNFTPSKEDIELTEAILSKFEKTSTTFRIFSVSVLTVHQFYKEKKSAECSNENRGQLLALT